MPDKPTSLRQRRKLLQVFRDQYGLTLNELGEAAKVSQPMLSQFENGKRDLSPEAWLRVLSTIQKLLVADDARRKQEREKAAQTAAKLGAGFESLFGPLFDNETKEQAEKEYQKALDHSGLELWKLISAQTDELLPHFKTNALAYARKHPEKVLQEYLALWNDVEAKDRRIAELEEELRVLKAKEQSNE